MRVPGGCKLRARWLARLGQALGRPLLVALVEERQVEQPFAGIVDDVERQRTVGAVLALVVDDQAQFADVDRRVRPAALFDQGADMAFVIKARHRIVRLRLEGGGKNRRTAQKVAIRGPKSSFTYRTRFFSRADWQRDLNA